MSATSGVRAAAQEAGEPAAPNESCTLMCGEVGRHLIEGISDGFVPGIFARHRHIIDEIVAVDSDAAIREMRRLARECGLFVGPSSGAHLLAARELRARYPPPSHMGTMGAGTATPANRLNPREHWQSLAATNTTDIPDLRVTGNAVTPGRRQGASAAGRP